MKIFVVLVLALACISAASIPQTPVALKDAVSPNVIQGRITNGHQAYATDFPYQVGLSLSGSSGSFWCGGSLIAKKWVLTAAHCTDKMESVTVYLGSTVREKANIVYNVDYSSIIQHLLFNPITLANDLALIEIPDTYTYTDEIQPISLADSSDEPQTYVNKYAIASGWGRTHDHSETSSNLNYVYLPVIENDKCAKTYGKLISKKILCVAATQGQNICQGDSGGPLVLDSKLIGVTSFVSTAGCQSGYPSGFSRVANYLDWIKFNTNK